MRRYAHIRPRRWCRRLGHEGGIAGGAETEGELEVNPLRNDILRVYKDLLTVAAMMPTKNRRDYVVAKVRSEFRQDPYLRDTEELTERLALARAQLSNAEVQARHLTMWLGGRDDTPADDPLEMGPEEPAQDPLGFCEGYDWQREWDTWLIRHPRYAQPEEAGTLVGIERWKKMVRNKKAR
eukprot:Hpha_TRINITY_DN25540_c0_g1::TRINITY_DN25540_c0_g1_i1::g.17690::m.17690